MLELVDVHAYYGESHVLQGISLQVAEGRVVALLGRNGAGKSTTLRTIMGLTRARRGSIRFAGREIAALPAFEVARAGIGFVPSGRRVFADLTVRQNLLLGASGGGRTNGAWTMDRVCTLFPKLASVADRRAQVLSGGEQQMLKLARCLLGQPRMLLLDEPTEGLAPIIVRQLRETLVVLRESGFAMLISEQNARFALEIADHGYLIEKGVIRHVAAAAELKESVVLAAHLGV